MRILIVTTDFPPAPGRPSGGVAAAVANLVLGLLEVRPDLDIAVVQFPARQDRPATTWGNTSATLQKVRGGRSATHAPTGGPARKALEPLITAFRPDVVHVQNRASLVDGRKHPAVLTVHGINELDVRFRTHRLSALRASIMAARERPARARYRHVIAIAGYVVQVLGNASRGQVHFVPNAIDPAFHDPDNRAGQSPPVVLQVGRIVPLKNVQATIAAMSVLQRRGVQCRLRVVGSIDEDPAYVQRLRTLAHERGVADRVDFVGSLNQEGVRSELRQARVLALPSFQEAAPMVIAEAAAMGVPTVASPVGGVAEMVADGWSGALVDPQCPESLAAALTPLLQDPDHATTLGEHARQRAGRYHPVQVAQATLAVYELVQRERPASR